MTTSVQTPARLKTSTSTISPTLVLIAGWLVPGAGHLLLRRWIRGSLLFVSIASMFFIGISLQGLATTSGLSKTAVQRSLAHLVRRQLVVARIVGRTQAPCYRLLQPWHR